MSLQSVCKLTDILPDTGVCALVEGQQVAVFHIKNGNESALYAISNHDPFSGANVLSRGMVGGTGEAVYVASQFISSALTSRPVSASTMKPCRLRALRLS